MLIPDRHFVGPDAEIVLLQVSNGTLGYKWTMYGVKMPKTQGGNIMDLRYILLATIREYKQVGITTK